jgi:hypothetical protein
MNPERSSQLIASIDQVIAFFNARKMDLPDGLFDRKTQFVINGAPFETLLGAAQSPTDPLILMLTRGPAGFRFTSKGLQHALPDARIVRLSTPPTQLVESASLEAGDLSFRLQLSGTLRDSGEAVDAAVDVTLRLTPAGLVETAEASMDAATLQKIQQARRS